MAGFPVRCFTCGKVVGAHEEKYKTLLKNKGNVKEFFETHNYTRMCCRRMFLGYVEVFDKLLLFPQDIDLPKNMKKEIPEE